MERTITLETTGQWLRDLNLDDRTVCEELGV